MNLERLKSRKMLMLLAVPAGAVALTDCAGPNYSGNGNEFVVHGQVTDPGRHSLKARILRIDEASGKADGWFSISHVHQIHDNCDCGGGFWNTGKRVGEVLDSHEQEISPNDVAIGACVRFTGEIRASRQGKTTEDRPVYEVAQLENCPRVDG